MMPKSHVELYFSYYPISRKKKVKKVTCRFGRFTVLCEDSFHYGFRQVSITDLISLLFYDFGYLDFRFTFKIPISGISAHSRSLRLNYFLIQFTGFKKIYVFVLDSYCFF